MVPQLDGRALLPAYETYLFTSPTRGREVSTDQLTMRSELGEMFLEELPAGDLACSSSGTRAASADGSLSKGAQRRLGLRQNLGAAVVY